MPKSEKSFMSGAGSAQRVDLPDGDILLPVCFRMPGTSEGHFQFQGASTVVRCVFDGKTLSYIKHGTEMTMLTGRGFLEPSLAHAGGRYFLTLRNDDAGYVTWSEDGLHFEEPRRWRFDDGSDLGNYNTQQHWVTHGNALYLVYTRRGAGTRRRQRVYHDNGIAAVIVQPEDLQGFRGPDSLLDRIERAAEQYELLMKYPAKSGAQLPRERYCPQNR